ncbi:MAG: Swt1 family HEPN domain-containing protein, partial [Bdellovibrionota bacterium]
HQRVGEALELLGQGLSPYVKQELEPVHGPDWAKTISRQLSGKDKKVSATDVHFLLSAMWEQWHSSFSKTLGANERNLVKELQGIRNAWAHQENFSTDDSYRALDSVYRLLQAIAAEQAAQVDKLRAELLRIKFEEQARHERRKTGSETIEGAEVAGLPPWREIIVPHPDVASGRYQQAEFAADLAQVHRGDAAKEYQEPVEFFRRTFLTEGLTQLLVQAVQRLSNKGGAPIVDLQTNFGGGKTHSLLALHHICSGKKASELPGIEAVVAAAETGELPKKVNRVVLVGTAIAPGLVHKKDDGCKIHTLWGEMAWQLGGKTGYSIVKDMDENGTSPGDKLVELFRKYSPCLILIDEWVAYARQLYGKDGLPAGSFDAHFTFAQALCEAARAVPGVFLVVSIPASEPTKKNGGDGITEIEIGGEGGRAALERLKNVIRRMESPWRPASAEESFEIVRRRLFEPMDTKNYVRRDAVARKFFEFYMQNAKEFPADCRDGDYENRVRAAYPIHPELFDRLYEDWSSLERFQRTRGVLRLMAAVIHNLWESNDRSPLIMPCSVPISDRQVAYELTQYLDDHWVPVIESDIDGGQSLPIRLDRENPNFGRLSATRRVARTIYLGSAPTLRTANQGIDDRNIKLGCAFPGESPSVFGDALRRLSDQA